MQPTVAPMWRGWAPMSLSEGPRMQTVERESEAKLRAILRDLSLELRLAYSNTNFKVYNGNEERHFLRLQAALHKMSQSDMSQVPPEWVQHFAPWLLPGVPQRHVIGGGGVASGPHGGGPPLTAAPSAWWSLPLGFLLLTFVVWVMRSGDRCLIHVLLKHEYPEAPPEPPEAPPFADLPPSYSQCSKQPAEPPPPPYSACYVAYTPKEQAVGFYDSQHQTLFAGPSDTGQTEARLVFEDGRVLERPPEEADKDADMSSPVFLV